MKEDATDAMLGFIAPMNDTDNEIDDDGDNNSRGSNSPRVDGSANTVNAKTIAAAKDIAEHVHQCADELLERLFSYLSKLPEVVVKGDSFLQNDNDNNDDDDDCGDTSLQERGMTIPVSAVAWISGQFDALSIFNNDDSDNEKGSLHDNSCIQIKNNDSIDCSDRIDNDDNNNDNNDRNDNETYYYDIENWIGIEQTASLRYRLNLLRFLLPRVQLIRLTRQPWPPSSQKFKATDIDSMIMQINEQNRSSFRRFRKIKRERQQEQQQAGDPGIDNVNTADFLRYTKMLLYGGHKYLNLRTVFPNAKVLILDSVPPSWVDLHWNHHHQQQQQQRCSSLLRVVKVQKAAVYNLSEFLFGYSSHFIPSSTSSRGRRNLERPVTPADTTTVTTTTTINTAISKLGETSLSLPPSLPPVIITPPMSSLTHLKLESCCLGELTVGFRSCFSQLRQLTYLSLHNNEFKNARTVLKALKGLERLKFLDVSNNRIMGKFGPNANLYLSGQVRILKLSGNLLVTCNDSGLEKCYAIQELWLDDNLIDNVIEVSGLSSLPDLQLLQLQRNTFNMKTIPKTAIVHSSLLTSRNGNKFLNGDKKDTNNPLYDPDWKICLWTWFQQERRATTPLELPILNKKKTKHDGNNNFIDVGRMTRDEWDLIREESFFLSTTDNYRIPSKLVPTNKEVIIGVDDAEESDVTRDGLTSTNNTQMETEVIIDTLIVKKESLVLGSSSRPSRNRRVTKKCKPRQVTILDTYDKVHNYDTTKKYVRRNKHWGQQKKRSANRGINYDGKLKTTKKFSLTKDKAYVYDGKSSSADSSSISRKYRQKTTYAPLSSGGSIGISFSLEDVIDSLQQPCQQQHQHNQKEKYEFDQIQEEKDVSHSQYRGDEKINTSTIASMASKECGIISEDTVTIANSNTYQTIPLTEEASIKALKDFKRNDISNNPATVVDRYKSVVQEDVEENAKFESDTDGKFHEVSNTGENIRQTSPIVGVRSTSDSAILQTCSSHQTTDISVAAVSTNKDDRIFSNGKVNTIKLTRTAPNYNKTFDVLNSDWEEVIKRASEGRISDGWLRSPIETNNLLSTNESRNLFTNDVDGNIFSDEVTDLLAANTTIESKVRLDTIIDTASASRSANGSVLNPSSTPNRMTSALPELIWQEDDSVLSSLGGSREDFLPKRANKFLIAEENSEYDGSASCRGMKVMENLQLYFDNFVFPTSIPDIPQSVRDEMEEDEDDWQLTTLYHPRIQLWPDDRRMLERKHSISISSIQDSTDWTANRERFLKVWKEDIVPCGKPSLRRLPPNRRIRLGFHGDKMFEGSDVDAYSERRKVLLCLSSKALYVILDNDDVTMSYDKKQAKKRRFPLPIDLRDRFRDAPWPHAVARHSLKDLVAICIGFEFQRLTLRFKNSLQLSTSSLSAPYVYVLLTADKRSTVRIFQEIQKLAKDLNENDMTNTPGKNDASNMVVIENDSNLVFDGLNNLIETTDQTLGTVMHFQIVQQRWNRGNRGTVRRVCVITDTRIMLLDEDYIADGHDLSTITVAGEKMAEVRYSLVDQAVLSLVSQVQAANTDPLCITIIIKPSALSRTHRWRLVCRDREGAERLVEDARKALEKETNNEA